ncbi:hydrolase 1, exosortase A system-associated [Methylomagnum ishizawai]|uniref:hydrolase 1, exosortase A system-associated n=1 Tax=Methylomagnum ishizawai TaxID=1760988 RepID=UPI001C33102F|nr:hydrolase 1, exosortase A system-associated [Methylomagnum ishizawai]BBL75338.1 hypothetical protein MishRS11D_24360 [Methylomagnum ishizawai]
MKETTFTFDCQGSPLVGICHHPDRPARRGVLMVLAGGPQYRVGGHRQLTLWARRLAAEGYPVFRFDYRGTGDSHGEFRGYKWIDEDIRAAIDRFCEETPGLTEIVLWGECNAATAIVFYAYRDPRVRGMVLLNPWTRTAEGQARTLMRHYYLDRLKNPDFWKKVFSFQFDPVASLRSLVRLARLARQAGPASPGAAQAGTGTEAPLSRDLPLPEAFLAGFSRFQGGPVMLVMSGRDLIAREFDEAIQADPQRWEPELRAKRCCRHDTLDGDHTFSSEAQRAQVADWAIAWLASW